MTRRLVINLALAGLVGLLGVLVLLPSLWPADDAGPAEATTSLGQQLGLAADGPTHLRVRRGADQVRLSKHDGRWRVISPVNARADAAHLEIIHALRTSEALRRVDGHDLSGEVTGLDTPLVVQYDDSPPVRIGGPGPNGATRYVAAAGQTWLVPLAHYDNLAWHWTDWLDRALLPDNRALRRIVLPDYTLENTTTGWQVQPDETRGAAAAAATASAWRRAAALAVVPADRSRERLARVTLVFGDTSRQVFDIIERGPNLVLRSEALGVDYHLAGNRIGPLLNLVHPGLSK
ncbi:DUF4340 domain-containing protein [Salinisphaera japonica]|uniref:DUF4340 domain-containing protein n=1 Tax=Salinisphaera japonica YTM-1 TaxID=1209778 RepID=A0A423PWZ3_9GAMM|nr:DUF4340 domain-containing protein [Salinisphaera japonica]ROO30133.1 hypothetical protein SAJA_05440 [Salinisphaera japonica YTM-1]